MSHPLFDAVSPSTPPDPLEALAHQRVRARLGWLVHAVAFVLVNVFLWAISTAGWGQRAWSVYPLLGWGLGLVLHGLAVFVVGPGSRLSERMVERERAHVRRSQAHTPPPAPTARSARDE